MIHTDRWIKSCRFGRFIIGYRCYRHRYPSSGIRWVIQPYIIFDQKW